MLKQCLIFWSPLALSNMLPVPLTNMGTRWTWLLDHYLSDHASVLCVLYSAKPSLSVRTVSYRKWKSVDMEDLDADLAKSDLCENPPADLDELVSCYHDTLRAAMDAQAPLKTKTIVVRPRVPWYNDDFREAKRARRQAERKWRQSKLLSDFQC